MVSTGNPFKLYFSLYRLLHVLPINQKYIMHPFYIKQQNNFKHDFLKFGMNAQHDFGFQLS